jgi:SagB-type dehydrogenase family enzyme
MIRHLIIGGKLFATLVPISPNFRFRSGIIKPKVRYVLSRFAFCRRSGSDLIIESPLSHAQLMLHDPRTISIFSKLSQPAYYSDFISKENGISKRTALLLMNLFHNAGALSEVTRTGRIREEEDPALKQWEFHDLLFHSRSRTGRHSNPYGKTEPFKGKIKAPRAIIERSGKKIQLESPDIAALCKKDSPFTQVVEQRRSRRQHKEPAITLSELGELLYRSARVRSVSAGEKYQITGRVYPGSGAAYELEIYLVINRCKGISAGLYHYCPLKHQLCRISFRTQALNRLLQSAAYTAHTSIPQILLILSARFQRMMWRYRSISYASILKDAGVLFQNFYLVASAMNLAACALGVGNSDLFAKVARTNYYEETSVGEMILGK